MNEVQSRSNAGSSPGGQGIPAEEAKLREEIRSLKQQRLLAILSTIGAVAAFIILHYTEIQRILYPPPRVKLVVEDSFLKRVGQVWISPTAPEKKASSVKTSVAEALDWMPMEPGSYDVVVVVDGQQYLHTSLFLRAGDKEGVVVPSRHNNTILVTVTNETPKPPPGSPLQLNIEASGNGFLWVYDLAKDGGYSLVYPSLIAGGSTQNEIRVGEPFRIPDASNAGIYVSDEPVEEKLLFVVTSSRERGAADKVAARFAAATVSKATAGVVDENWGVFSLTYKVTSS